MILKDESKNKFQKFTPEEFVEIMLTIAGYTDKLVGKKVLENSFGAGNILIAIVKRYIQSAQKKNMLSTDIAVHLGEDIYGIELDQVLFEDVKNNLKKLLKEYGIPDVDWKLYNEDALKWENDVKFDYIIGNPPYISYRDIDESDRAWIRRNFKTCINGKFDYCYAFVESGVNRLNDTGKLVQLVPNNIYKNVFAENLRNMLLPHISYIIDYPNQTLFGETLTSSSIFLYDKAVEKNTFTYCNDTDNIKITLNKSDLSKKWIFAEHNEATVERRYIRFGDRFNASLTVATLLNDAYVLTEEKKIEANIEDRVLRNAASPRRLRNKIKEYIIFPYDYRDGVLVRYNENEFQEAFPNAYHYLDDKREALDSRNKDKNITWFEYGRSQALTHLDQPKLLISSVITNECKVYSLERDVIPYSGLYITSKDPQYSLDDARRIIESDEFLKYILNIGTSVRGKSKRISCKDINNYIFEV